MEQNSNRTRQIPSEQELLDLPRKELEVLLPSGWTVSRESPPAQADGVVRISAPDGNSASLLVEAKSLMNPRDVLFVLDQMMRFGEGMDAYMMVARYLSPRARELLEAKKVSYVDAAGNVFVSLESPGLLIRTKGQDSDPFRGPERRTNSLKGGPASRVVRALVDFRPPWKMRGLAESAGTSLASTSRVVDFLDREALVSRNELGSIVDADWPGLLERWAEDYELVKKRGRVTNLIAPRGLESVADRLKVSKSQYALSGSMAAQAWAPYADPRLGLIYTRDTEELLEFLGVRSAQSRPNFIAIEPLDDLPFMRTVEKGGLNLVAPSQAVVDLLAGPGRNPEEGNFMLDWMKENESTWRST